jgi:hypothetical protein
MMNCKSFFLLFSLLLLLLLSACRLNTTPVQRIPECVYEDRMRAAWIGQMVGVGWAAVTEYKWIGEIIPEEKVPKWEADMVNQYNQDDLYVEMNFLESMDTYGIDVPIRRTGIHFANSTFGLAAANKRGRENLRAGIAPPASSHPLFNINCEDIDYQIESEYSGIIAPGMLQVPVHLGEKFGRLMNYGDGMYAGQFIGGMYAAAYFEHDIKTIINKGLTCIPDSSCYAACIRDVLSWYDEDSLDWQNTWEKIVDKYYRTLDYQPYHRIASEAWVGIDAKLNGAFVVLGLLYGQGDIESTFYISVRSGFDSDCNPSSALGILFASMGLRNIPEKYYSNLDESRSFANSAYTFPKLVEVSKKLMKQFVIEQGGKIKTGPDGREYYVIPVKQPIPSTWEKSWMPDTLDETAIRFTDAEMEEIKYSPSSPLEKVPGWSITH